MRITYNVMFVMYVILVYELEVICNSSTAIFVKYTACISVTMSWIYILFYYAI
jgi:hypothetical protein